jgi:putative membrane protein insertion efficiency factor
VKYLIIGFLKFWRLVVSPLYGDVCKFYPTCSAYALDAVQANGAIRGTWLTLRRIVRCHPWSLGGYDPAPGTAAAAEYARELELEAAELELELEVSPR